MAQNRTKLAVSAALFVLLTLQSCYTGVETTPKISAEQVKREVGKPTAEQLLLADISLQPLALWTPGKEFVLTQGKYILAYHPQSVAATLAPGDTLRYVSSRSTTALTGNPLTEILLQTSGGETVGYRAEGDSVQISRSETFSLPYAIELSPIMQARKLLQGRELWSLERRRHTPDGTPVTGRKFEKLTVMDVTAGTPEAPLRLLLRNNSGQVFTQLVNIGGQTRNGRSFASQFAITDPRKRYPQISDENWERICNGQVATDMTTEECRLALGQPAQVERDATYGGILERWTYEDGKYLRFLDNRLTSFR